MFSHQNENKIFTLIFHRLFLHILRTVLSRMVTKTSLGLISQAIRYVGCYLCLLCGISSVGGRPALL